MIFIEELKQCATDHDCKEGKAGLCSRWHCRLATECKDCGWLGEVREAVHAYRDDGMGDVEPIDECPKCGGENLS
jgi:hypothetical protein